MTTRRVFATLTVAAGLAISVAAPGSGANALVPPDQGGMTMSMYGAPRPGATQHRHQVAVARDATRKFHDIARAQKHGYALFRDQDGIACIAMPHMGAMGRHLVNGDVVGSPRVNLRRPEALVYAGSPGHRRLVALEYLVLRKDWRKVHGASAPRPSLFGQSFDLTRGGNRYGLPAFYSLHAWIWKHNPAGTFAMWNPDVHCHCSH
jgi:hypothetical protein